MGPPRSVVSTARELSVEVSKGAMAPNIARLEERMDHGELQMRGVAAKNNENETRLQFLEEKLETLAEITTGRALPEAGGPD